MMDIPITSQSPVRCRNCFKQTAENSGRCEHCGGEIEPAAPKTLLGKIKQVLGIESSSGIIAINLQDSGHFFSNQEIESLLDLENVTVLDLEDVPDRERMFYKSKRIRKPIRRTKSP
jgi:hypothetical protein